jgi:hypothetical protein
MAAKLLNPISGKMEWTIRVSILRNTIILKQLGFAIGIPFGILIVILILTKAYYGLTLVGVLFLLTFLFIQIVWGGKYDVGFELDSNGIRSYTLKDQANKNRIVNSLAVVLGLLSGKPAVSGAGMLAQSRQDVYLKWKNIKKINYVPSKHVVMVKGGFTENLAVFCTKDNYAEVESLIQANLQEKPVQPQIH